MVLGYGTESGNKYGYSGYPSVLFTIDGPGFSSDIHFIMESIAFHKRSADCNSVCLHMQRTAFLSRKSRSSRSPWS
jgi:hypothetical protein